MPLTVRKKFCFHPYCFFGSHFTFQSAECCRVWVQENYCSLTSGYLLHLWKTLFYVLTDNILQPLLSWWSLTLKLPCSKRSSIIYPAKVVFYLYNNIYVALTHLIPTYMHISDYLKNGRKKKFEKAYLVSLKA